MNVKIFLKQYTSFQLLVLNTIQNMQKENLGEKVNLGLPARVQQDIFGNGQPDFPG